MKTTSEVIKKLEQLEEELFRIQGEIESIKTTARKTASEAYVCYGDSDTLQSAYDVMTHCDRANIELRNAVCSVMVAVQNMKKVKKGE